MNPEVKAKWLQALRSGKYEQTTGRLSNDGCFCCLGVLCSISGLPYDHSEYGKILPYDVMEWAGLEQSNPDIWMDDGSILAIAKLNDDGWSFQRLADIIEQQL